MWFSVAVESEVVKGLLLAKGADGYAFGPGKVYNLNSDDHISGHSDIAVPEVGYAIAKAMSATL